MDMTFEELLQINCFSEDESECRKGNVVVMRKELKR